MNGFGRPSRETGHKRVPAPPDKITGITEVGKYLLIKTHEVSILTVIYKEL